MEPRRPGAETRCGRPQQRHARRRTLPPASYARQAGAYLSPSSPPWAFVRSLSRTECHGCVLQGLKRKKRRTDIDLRASDIKRPAVEGEAFGESGDCVLRCGVGDRVGAGRVRRERAVVDDTAFWASGLSWLGFDEHRGRTYRQLGFGS